MTIIEQPNSLFFSYLYLLLYWMGVGTW